MRHIGHSQNFIRNNKVLESLIRDSSISKNDLVVEIGAGDGRITKILGLYSKKVIAVEKDKILYNKMFNKLKNKPNMKIINSDVFKFKFPGSRSYKVFSNIPFNFTADIIRLLTELQNQPDDIYLFMQKQAAEYYVGLPKTKESLKSLFLKIYFEPGIVYELNRDDFYPIPDVDIILLRLKKRSKALLPMKEIINFKDFVVYAFNQTKPNLKEGLETIFTIIQFKEISNKLRIKPTNKPRDLSVQQWLGLYDIFNKDVDKTKKSFVKGSYQKLLEQQKSLKKIYRTRVDKNWRER